jgi:hypothetical protein
MGLLPRQDYRHDRRVLKSPDIQKAACCDNGQLFQYKSDEIRQERKFIAGWHLCWKIDRARLINSSKFYFFIDEISCASRTAQFQPYRLVMSNEEFEVEKITAHSFRFNKGSQFIQELIRTLESVGVPIRQFFPFQYLFLKIGDYRLFAVLQLGAG